jgi:hypothetical protein
MGLYEPSKLEEDKMETANQLNQMVDTISNAIVALVERTDGPVTLAQIERDVPGFAEGRLPAWEYFVEEPDEELLIWDGMTQAGTMALGDILRGRKVAVQLVNVVPYLLDGRVLMNDKWWPIVLLPKEAANLSTPRWLMRVAQSFKEYAHGSAIKEGLSDQVLTPRSLRFSADQFAVT